jgi:hypothetical protein
MPKTLRHVKPAIVSHPLVRWALRHETAIEWVAAGWLVLSVFLFAMQ